MWILKPSHTACFNSFSAQLAAGRHFWQFAMLMFALQWVAVAGQGQNPYGLSLTTTPEQLQLQADSQPALRLVALEGYIPNLRTQWVYAGKHNFTGRVLYQRPAAYLRAAAATRLLRVADSLSKMGLGIWVFDAYRPYAVTLKMWEVVPDDRYAANPATGSGHNRGIAVDLTLYNLQTGQPLAMPTGFDSFSDTAHHDFDQLPSEVIKNRALLKNLMESAGFVALPTEWWHYSLPQPKNYPLMDLSFKQLRHHWRRHHVRR